MQYLFSKYVRIREIMQKIRTHYDNLKIPHHASQTEIKQAYRKLIQKYHPDKNKSPDAERISQIIVHAYRILSNPKTRKEHDIWISNQEYSYNNAFKKAKEEARRKQAQEESCKKQEQEKARRRKAQEEELKRKKEQEEYQIWQEEKDQYFIWKQKKRKVINIKLLIFIVFAISFSMGYLSHYHSITNQLHLFINNTVNYINYKYNIIINKNYQYELARKYEDTGSYTEAFILYETVAQKGDIDAQYKIAQMYGEGKGIDKNESLQEYWMKKSCQNDPSRIWCISLSYAEDVRY